MTAPVAVVVTAHNYGRFLDACLTSLAAQTQLPAEVVVVDDGSVDDTPEVLNRLRRELAPSLAVHVIRHAQPAGFAASLNEGIRATTTPLVAHVDADDVCLPRYVEALRRALESHPSAAYAYPRIELVGDETGVYRSFPFHPGRLIFEGNYIPNVALMRRAAFDETPGFRSLATHVDWDLWLAMLARGHRGVLVDEVLYQWRRHQGAMTYQARSVRLRVRADILWSHRRLALRHATAAVPWTWQALRRRWLPAGDEARTPSGWIEKGTREV